MVSDIEFYQVRGLSTKQIGSIFENSADITFIGKTKKGKLYDCNWIDGAYLTIREGDVQIELDGSDTTSSLQYLKKLLDRELVEVSVENGR